MNHLGVKACAENLHFHTPTFQPLWLATFPSCEEKALVRASPYLVSSPKSLTMGLLDLPDEVLLAILGFIEKPSHRLAVSMICRKMSEFNACNLYKDVTMRTGSSGYPFANLLSSRPCLGQYVRGLDLDDLGNCLVMHCPTSAVPGQDLNLRKIIGQYEAEETRHSLQDAGLGLLVLGLYLPGL